MPDPQKTEGVLLTHTWDEFTTASDNARKIRQSMLTAGFSEPDTNALLRTVLDPVASEAYLREGKRRVTSDSRVRLNSVPDRPYMEDEITVPLTPWDRFIIGAGITGIMVGTLTGWMWMSMQLISVFGGWGVLLAMVPVMLLIGLAFAVFGGEEKSQKANNTA